MYYDRYLSTVNFTEVDHLKKIVNAHDQNMAQLALAQVLGNPAVTSAIIGASSIKQLEENLGTSDVKLTKEESKVFDEVRLELRPPRFFYGR